MSAIHEQQEILREEIAELKAKNAMLREALGTAVWRLQCAASGRNLLENERSLIKEWANEGSVALTRFASSAESGGSDK